MGFLGFAENHNFTTRAGAMPEMRVGGDRVAEQLKNEFKISQIIKNHRLLVFGPRLGLLLISEQF